MYSNVNKQALSDHLLLIKERIWSSGFKVYFIQVSPVSNYSYSVPQERISKIDKYRARIINNEHSIRFI